MFLDSDINSPSLSIQQVREKWRKMKKAYYEATAHNAHLGGGRRREAPYHRQLEQILGPRPAYNPRLRKDYPLRPPEFCEYYISVFLLITSNSLQNFTLRLGGGYELPSPCWEGVGERSKSFELEN